jgi:hypothetical protein
MDRDRSTGPPPEPRPGKDTYMPEKPSAWTGWVVFGGMMMILVGTFNAVEGLAGILDNGFYPTNNTALFNVNLTGWGWYMLVMGVVLVLTGMGVIGGRYWARVVAVVVLMLNALSHLFSVPIYPAWSVIVITLDVLIIYAIITHGHEFE